jgi:hypothetical protein
MSDRSLPPDDDSRVVRFRPRGSASRARWRWPSARDKLGDSPVDGLAKYERGESDDDYRHRMKMNALALVFTVLLMAAGIWLVGKLADLRKAQDCVLSGRKSCATVELPPRER